jgi:hypothetical protein
MDASLGLGLLLLGAGVGSLVTAIFYSGQIRQLRREVESIRDEQEHDHAA